MKFEAEELDRISLAIADRVAKIIADRLDLSQNAGLPPKVSYNEKEAAAMLGMTRWALRDRRLAGKAKASHGTRPVLYSLADIQAVLEQMRTSA